MVVRRIEKGKNIVRRVVNEGEDPMYVDDLRILKAT